MHDRLNGELGQLVALAPPEHGRINALVRQTCAKTLSLPPLPTEVVVDGPADEAESVAVDSPNSSASTCHPSATNCGAGSRRRWASGVPCCGADLHRRLPAASPRRLRSTRLPVPWTEAVVWDHDSDLGDVLFNGFSQVSRGCAKSTR